MLRAEKLKTYEQKRFRPGYVSVKRNGIHGICSKDDGLYSRTPNKILGLDYLEEELNQSPFPLCVELVIPELPFETMSGLIRNHSHTPGVVAHVFNVISPGPFEKRLQLMTDLKNRMESESVKFETYYAVNKTERFDTFYEQALAEEEEGVCWISPNHLYQPGKRGWDWMKRVPMMSNEGIVLDIIAGTAGKKYETSMGRMHIWCEELHQSFYVGIFKGQTDEWRQKVFNEKRHHIGRDITFEYKNLSKYGVPTQTRFKSFRWDL